MQKGGENLNNLKQFRESKGLTQKQLAEAIGVNLCVIHTYEQGIRTPPLKMALKIAKFFNVKVEEIFNERQ